jgi:hypothetical protein
MKKVLLLVVAFLAGCAPPPIPALSTPGLDANAGPTAYIAPSYPTAAAQQLSTDQQASGVEVRIDRAWQDGKQLNADVCFTLPDDSDWAVWKASLQFPGNAVTDFGTTLQSLQPGSAGQPGQRCDTLNFYVPPDADLSNATISIDSIAAIPREGEYCDVYLPKIQAALEARGVGIALECLEQDGVRSMKIASFPPDMTQQQAEEIVYSDEFYSIQGPWVFTFNLTQ